MRSARVAVSHVRHPWVAAAWRWRPSPRALSSGWQPDEGGRPVRGWPIFVIVTLGTALVAMLPKDARIGAWSGRP